MEIINIEDIESTFEKTLLYFLNYIYECEYRIDEKYVKQFMDKYLKEAKKKIQLPEATKLKEKLHIKFVDKNIINYEQKVEEILTTHNVAENECHHTSGEDYWKLVGSEAYRTYCFLNNGPNSSLYNFCSLLIDFDRLLISLKEYIDNYSYHYYVEAQQSLDSLQGDIVMLVNGVTSFMLDMYADNIMDLSQNHMLMPDIMYYFKPHKKLLSFLELIYKEDVTCREFLNEKETHLFPVLCMSCETIILRKKIDVLKFILVFLIMIKSPEYSPEWKMYAYQFIEACKDMFFCATLHRMVIQKAELEGEAADRCSADNTTRMQMIFSLENNDIYILRIDMPHQGEEKLHINIEECHELGVIASGFPLKTSESKCFELKKLLGSHFDELFYTAGNRIWFRTRFKNKLQHADIESEIRERVEQIFNEQSHKEIITNYSEEQVLAFFEEVKKYLEEFQLTHMLQTELRRNNEKVYYEVKKIRKNLDILQRFWKLMDKKGCSPVAVRDCLWEIYRDQGLEEMNESKESLEQMELSALIELIGKNCV